MSSRDGDPAPAGADRAQAAPPRTPGRPRPVPDDGCRPGAFLRSRLGMTIMAPEPDPDARERASDSAAVVDAVADGSDRSLPSRGELVLLVAPERDDPRAVPDMGVASPAGRLASPSGGRQAGQAAAGRAAGAA
jgi:hypothetical protein